MPNKFKSLPDILNKDKAFSNFRKSVRENDVVVEFEEIFPKLKNTVTASNINKGILYLIVDNSVLRNEIFINKKLMIEKINTHFDQQIIVDVKFTNFRNSHRKIT